MVEEYSLKIEAETYDHLSLKLGHVKWMSEGSLTAWSCISGDANDELVSETASISRSWLKSQVESWADEVDHDAKRNGLRDTSNIIPLLVHSGIPLKEFEESSFMIKGESSHPNKPWGSEEQPQPHVALAIFSSLIYDTRKCAVVDSAEHVADCNSRREVRKSYVAASDTINSTFEALPVRRIAHRMDRVKKGTVAD